MDQARRHNSPPSIPVAILGRKCIALQPLLFVIVLVSLGTCSIRLISTTSLTPSTIETSQDNSSNQTDVEILQPPTSRPLVQDERSTDSIIEFMDGNFLRQTDSPNSVRANWKIISALDSGQASEVLEQWVTKEPSAKLNKVKNEDDWWLHITTKSPAYWIEYDKENRSSKKPGGSSTTSQPRKKARKYKPPVYTEQPLNQNAILTARNQLIAIREQHRLLSTRAIEQLIKLDEKLVEGYKACFKRDMPFHGGMLYQTRNYVTKLARDVKHHRQVLEDWAKKVQSRLQKSMRNVTLVREYNRMLDKQTHTQNTAIQVHRIRAPNQLTESMKPALAGSQEALEWNKRREKAISDFIRALLKTPRQNRRLPKFFSKSEDEVEWIYQVPKLRYPVHVNEVHLRKDLQSSQELIDRIDRVYREMSDLVDEVLMISKLEEVYANPEKFDPLRGFEYNNENPTFRFGNDRPQTSTDTRLKSPIEIHFSSLPGHSDTKTITQSSQGQGNISKRPDHHSRDRAQSSKTSKPKLINNSWDANRRSEKL